MELRPYQLELIDAVWREMFREDSALAQLPTGGGKTLCFSHLIRKCMEVRPDIRVVVLMGRVDLVLQTERALARVLERRHIGVLCGSVGRREVQRPVTVASIQSIEGARTPVFNLAIIDEVHNVNQEDGRYTDFIRGMRERNPKLKLVGFTATPFRTNDGEIYGDGKEFKRLCFRKTIQDMIAMGYLCRPILRRAQNEFDTSQLHVRAGEYVQEEVDLLVSDEELLRRQIGEAMGKLDGRRCVAWATANIAHCTRVHAALLGMGESAACVHSKQERGERQAGLGRFTGGEARHMVFVSILSEGFDHPPVDCVVLMRPTRSPVLYVQTVGRGLRISPGKENCLVLDFGQVVRELGPLDDPVIRRKREGEAPLKECFECHAWVPLASRECPECGHAFPPPLTEPAPPERRLTKRADDNAVILSEEYKPETEEVGPAIIEMHRSKSGNECVKITYSYGAMRTPWGAYDGVVEYFVTTSPWAQQRLDQRLEGIGAELPSIPFEGEVRVPGTYEVVKVRDGKFWRILSVRKKSGENPGEEAVDTSFDFSLDAEEEVVWN